MNFSGAKLKCLLLGVIKKINIKNNTVIKSGDYSFSFNKFVFDQVPSKSTCLDVGCWTGNLGKLLIKHKNCLVDGIDFKQVVLNKAQRNKYRKTYLMNLNNEFFDSKLILNKYEVIIFADILEHLINPGVILSYFKRYLTPGGQIIISLPNIAFLLYRIQLLLGQWNYREFGTLDKTHLRFYTIKSGVDMVKAAGFKIVEVKPYNQFGILRYIWPLDVIFPSLFAYQFMIIAKLK